MRFPALKWIGLALLGLLIATAVALAATSLISRQIGIDSESITAGDTLAPAFTLEAKRESEPANGAEAEPQGESETQPESQGESGTPTEPSEPQPDDGGEGGGSERGESADD